ncbi:hypothetical protein FJQ87_02890 [Shewanella sp. SNU WT4]|uniref:hypothetical protein n=1 Tax=Shewanella sp. SNU WT4 TaxID=2590015 RepID=UPI00112C4727|nr:hypothetical protein [Shewanella sp. SNU WT4]QDF65760.1 hypothetical protein FJQ87_02890 [Shewanella sp. SNU WT4]
MSLSAILTEAFYFFKNHMGQLAKLTLPILVIQVAIQVWLGAELRGADLENPQFGAGHGAAMMVLLLVFSLLIAALTLFMEWRSEGHQPTAMQVLSHSFAFVPPLLLAGVFSGLAILAPFFILTAFAGGLGIIGLGVSAYLFSRLAYVNFMVVTERLTPLESIKASFNFSGPIALKTMLILFLYMPFSLVGGLVASALLPLGLPVQIVVDTGIAFFSLFVNIALFRLYMVNRAPKAVNLDNCDNQ